MAYATITTATGKQLAFDMWRGQISHVQPVMDYFTRIGQTGTGAQQVRTAGDPAQVMGMALYSSLSDATTCKADVLALQGQRVTVVDPQGSFLCLVLKVSARVRGGAFSAGTALNKTYCTECQFLLEAQS